MSRRFHSSNAFVKGVARQAAIAPNGEGENSATLPPKTRYGYFFKQRPGDRLRESSKTVKNLMKLGKTMAEPEGGGQDSQIPSAYTYFGQFIAHDLTFDALGKHIQLTRDIEPMEVELVESLRNHRTGLLDLDCVYGPAFSGIEIAMKEGDLKEEFRLGSSYSPTDPLPDADLPRTEKAPHVSLIGDSRNDENIPLSQLHVAFLKAHNRLVRSGLKFDEAKSILRRRYQKLVIMDFLPRLVREDDLKAAAGKTRLYLADNEELFIPIEFTAAAFRFGHSMIRSEYEFNNDRGRVPLRHLFTRSALGGYSQLLSDWVIDWKNFGDGGSNKARTLCPQLVEPLGKLSDEDSTRFSLAVHDLLRGYVLGLPTGQAMADALDINPLTEAEILDSAVSDEQQDVLKKSGFAASTPLWFYLLAEAKQQRGGNFLGPVCGQLIAVVLERLVRLSNYGDDEPWNDILGKRDNFTLTEFLMQTVS